MTHGNLTYMDSLARTAPGQTVQVQDILFDLVRTRCTDAGVKLGDLVTCTSNRNGQVGLRFADGRSASLERHYAWFVRTSLPVSDPPEAAARASRSTPGSPALAALRLRRCAPWLRRPRMESGRRSSTESVPSLESP